MLLEKQKSYLQNYDNCLKESKLTNNDLILLFNDNKNNKYLLYLLHDILNPIVFYLKNKHDRVRPEFCFNKFSRSNYKNKISLPNHASYPSGHASSVYFLYEMTKDDLNLKDNNKKLADSISENREIAGLHYKDDTLFGKFIGEELCRILKKIL